MSKTFLSRIIGSIIFFGAAGMAGAGCGQISPLPNPDDVVVRSTIKVGVNASSAIRNGIVAKIHPISVVQPVTITSSPQTSIGLNNSEFSPPTVTPTLLDFGYLGLSNLLDNDLRVCGQNGNQKCGTALIRIYTTGQSGAGLYNSTDGYGAPLLATFGSAVPAVIGLETVNAVVLQTYAIPSNKNVLRLSDFSPNPLYNVKADFSNAGSGTYSTTIVIEYALAP